VIPSTLAGQVDRTISFASVKQDISSYQGKLILVGGEVLSAKRTKDHTQLQILQLPLDTWLDPVADRMTSQGRFLAYQDEFLDPATFPAGTRITLVGEVTGASTLPLDEIDYVYPVLKIRHLKVWPWIAIRDIWSPYGYYWRPTYPWPYAPVPKQ
jgi:outer membrane lipoprotein